MIRNLKALGLALVAVFALSALAVSAASAQEQGELTSDGPVTLTGTETGTPINDNFFRNSLGAKITCAGSTYTGHKVLTTKETEEGKKHQLLKTGDKEATVTPHYAKLCQTHIPILGTRPTTVTTNGCDFNIKVGTTTPAGNKEGTYGATASVKCPVDKAIVVHIYKAGSVNHPVGDAICTITIGEKASEPGKPHTGALVNQNLTGIHLTHTTAGGADDFDMSGLVTGIHEEHFGTLCGGTEAEEQTRNDAELNIDVTVKGHPEGGVGETGVTITE
jgi:hypothetical protein